jgi:hypothetical protein
MSRNIEDLDKRIDQLRARRQKLVARESVKARSLRTRQAVIIGTWIMGNRPELAEEVVGQLTRPQDLQAFGRTPQS